MDFQPTPDDQELRDRVRAVAQTQLAPLAPTADESDGLTPEVTAALSEAGLFRYVVPEAYGGTGIRATNVCIIREELGRVSTQADTTFAMQGIGSYGISIAGSEKQKRKYLPKVAAGEHLATFALTESEAGSDVASIQATARLDGDSYVINGQKKFISQSGHASFYLVFCKTDPAAGARGISVLIVEAGTPGFDTSESIGVMGPHALGAPRFSDCRVPSSNLIGEPGQGIKIAFATLDMFRATVGAFVLGLAQTAFHAAIRYAKERRAFGQTLADFQSVQFKLADMQTEIEAARYLVYHAAWLKDQGQPVTAAASMAKLYATEMAQRVVDEALQIHGGTGLIRGSLIERLYRAVRQPRIYEGASEIQKLTIARHILSD